MVIGLGSFLQYSAVAVEDGCDAEGENGVFWLASHRTVCDLVPEAETVVDNSATYI